MATDFQSVGDREEADSKSVATAVFQSAICNLQSAIEKWGDMFGFAWLTLRQIQEALETGRLEEALRLLRQPGVRNHRKAGELLVRLARKFAERGERHLGLDETELAWNDLLQAEALETGEKTPDRLRQALVGLGLAELRALMLAGDTARAEDAVGRLRQRSVTTGELGILEEGLRGWLRAKELAERGEPAQAQEAAAKAGRLLGVNPRFEDFRGELLKAQRLLPELLAKLHDAALGERWREVLERCEEILVLAPAHAEVRNLRSRAWKVLEPDSVLEPLDSRTAVSELPPRFWLWIDGVGGYLVCLGTRLTFGQALPGTRIDIPLVADVSRMHATLGRDGEGYVLESVRPMQVNGTTTKRSLLQSGDRFTLGVTCQCLFRLPVPGNNTARIDLVSGHRLPMSVDGVVLMAETLVIGPGSDAHVTAADLKQPIILFKHKDGLGVRSKAELRINGKASSGRALLPNAATVAGDDIAFAIEPAR